MNNKFLKAYARKLTVERRSTNPRAKTVSVTEAEAAITKALMSIAKTVAPQFVFGYHSRDDIEQQGVLFGLWAIENGSYDIARPIENFMFTHMRNRLKNYKRDQYIRAERPCECCEPFDPPPVPCERWKAWHARNQAKQNLMRPLDVHSISDEHEKSMRLNSAAENDAALRELEELIDAKLPAEFRNDYLRIKSGVNVSAERREEIRVIVKGLLDGSEEDEADTD